VLGGVISAVLLVPVPIFALDLSGVTWTETASSGTALINGISGDVNGATSGNAKETDIIFTVRQATTVNGSGSQTFTSSTLLTAGNSDTLNGLWKNLSALGISDANIFSSANLQITITASPPGVTGSNNMFNATPSGTGAYTSSNQPPASPPITSITSGLSNTSVITVVFTYSTIEINQNGPSSTTFTLSMTTP
jgi:hypothetical protein